MIFRNMLMKSARVVALQPRRADGEGRGRDRGEATDSADSRAMIRQTVGQVARRGRKAASYATLFDSAGQGEMETEDGDGGGDVVVKGSGLGLLKAAPSLTKPEATR